MGDAERAIDKSVITYEVDSGVSVKLSSSIIRKLLVQGKGNVTDNEVMMFLMLCKDQKLNPFVRDCYLIKYSDDSLATMVVGKDAFTKRAEKHAQHDGSQAGVIVEIDEGDVVEREGTMVRKTETLMGGWARVYRKDRKMPYYASASMDEYTGKKSNGTTNRQWSEKPATMIRKVALVQALREAYPDSLGGLYDAAEMTHVDGAALDEKPVAAPEVRTVTPEAKPAEALIQGARAAVAFLVDKSSLHDDKKAGYKVLLGRMMSVDTVSALRKKIEAELGIAPAAAAVDEQKELA